jgi:DmsE family decaheme c-type cytochrome
MYAFAIEDLMVHARAFRYLTVSCASALLVALLTQPASTSAATPPHPPSSPPPAAQAGYVGEDTCLGCHDDMTKGYADTAHGRAAHPRAPAAAQGCESCHGPGEKHVEDPSVPGSILRFDEAPPREANDACLSCHARKSHALWEGSAHDGRNLSCGTCHSVHNFKSERAQLKTVREVDTCASCHRVQSQKIMRAGHMPLAEGKMECSSCHNPHGSTNLRQLRVGNWINESCVSCHTDRRGPFLFEHAAGRESCITCHDPHGSPNDRMLVAKVPMLCQRCHIGTRHPSQIYDFGAVRGKSNRIINRGCVNCHQNIHGSNHPSGHSFLR